MGIQNEVLLLFGNLPTPYKIFVANYWLKRVLLTNQKGIHPVLYSRCTNFLGRYQSRRING